MSMTVRSYGHVGPDELRPAAREDTEGRGGRSAADLDAWSAEQGAAEGAGPFSSSWARTVCCGSRPVVANTWRTAHCPDPESWHAVAATLERAGIGHPSRMSPRKIHT